MLTQIKHVMGLPALGKKNPTTPSCISTSSAVLSVLVLGWLQVSTVLAAPPTQRRLSIVGDPSTSIGVAWTTSDEVATLIRYGTTASYGTELSGNTPTFVEGIGYVHEVTLQGLQPQTTYHYIVGDSMQWSEDATFTTASTDPCAPWSVVALGDNRTQYGEGGHAGVSKNFPPILAEAMEHQPSIILNSGDLVEDGYIAEQWYDYLDSTEPAASLVPMLTSIGNHDNDRTEGDTALYNKIFHLARNPNNNTEDFFSIRYQNVIFVVLSTQTFRSGTANDPSAFALQAQYLDEVLSENSDATWRIVMIHHPLFTGGGFSILGYQIGHEPNEKEQNAALLPVLDAHHVDLVFSGHNHWYERFEPMVQGNDPTQGQVVPTPADGTVHITTGGAGAYTMDFDFIPLLNVCRGDVDGTRTVCSGEHHYVVVDIAANVLNLEVWSTECQNTNCDATPAIIDQLSIVKPVGECPVVDAGMPDAISTDRSGADSNRDDAAHNDAGQNTDTRLADLVDDDIRTTDTTLSADTTAQGHDAEISSDAATQDPTQTDCGCHQNPTTATFFAALLLLALLETRRHRYVQKQR